MNKPQHMSKIKVLHLVKSLGRGGAEMLLQETLKVHNQDQFEFHYIYFLPWKNQMVEGIQQAGGKVLNFSASNNLVIILQIPKIIKYIRANKIDLLHCHLPWAGIAGRIIHKLIGIPTVYTEHNLQERYHFITGIINKITFNWQTQVISVSAEVATSIQKQISPKIPVATIMNGVNTEHFKRNELFRANKRKELGIGADEILIGNIAVFRFQKRLKEWIDIFKDISNEYPKVKACIVGDGILKEEIMTHLKTSGMEGRIIFPGLQTEVIPWLSAMDIFMMTSSYEGLPIALLEAMSLECAIVTTAAGGINELIRDGKDGFIKPVNDWTALKEPLKLLIEQPQLISKFGTHARKRVQESFSIKSMVDQIEKIYLDTFKLKTK